MGATRDTVLVVDDDREVVAVLAEALAEAGFRVRVAYDGQMALEAIRHAGADLVIADVRMPRLDGLALARALRDRANPPVVLLMSAWPLPSAEPGVEAIGKPFDLDRVVAAAAAAVARGRPIR
ncbi:MAG: response regulator [Chloroflexota bacterium]